MVWSSRTQSLLRALASLVAVGLLLLGAGSAAASPLVVGEDFDRAPVAGLDWLEDAEGTLDIDAAASSDRFEPLPPPPITLGFSDSVHWFRFTVNDRRAVPGEMRLVIDYAPLDDIRLYQPKHGGGWHESIAGDEHPFHEREIEHRTPVLPLEPHSGPTTYWLRVRSTSPVSLPLEIMTASKWEEVRTNELRWLWLYYGALLGLLSYNLLLAASLRDRAQWFYVLYVASFGTFLFIHNGFASQFLWPEATSWANQSFLVFSGLALAAHAFFSRDFLGTAVQGGPADRALKAFGLLGGVAAAVNAIVYIPSFVALGAALGVAGSVVVLSVAVARSREGNRTARLFIFASSTFLAGVLLGLLKAFGLLPTHPITIWGYQVAFALEALLLSAALAERFNGIRQRAEELNRTLERKVEERTRGLAEANQRLKEEIAERHLAEARHVELERQLQQSRKMEAVGRLAGGVAHDMNHVLSAIIGFASFIEERLDGDDETREDLGEILAAAKRGADLTNNLLGFSRRGDFERRPVGLDETVAQVANLLRRTVPKKVVVNDRARSGALVMGDSSQLHHALMNLCLNSVDAMDASGTLTLTTDEVTLEGKEVGALSPGRYARVVVQDDGSGMPPEIVEKACDPFFTTKELGKGTGLGLSMVFGTVDKHGGAMQIDSELGRGTTVTLYLPIATSAPRRKQVSERLRAVQAGRCILLVDDDAIVRRIAQRALEAAGHRVMVAVDGAEAVAAFTEQHADVDLVILDMVMPVMDGPEAFTRLREIATTTPVLISSGYSESGKAGELLERGAAGFLHKPYRPKELIAKVDEVLGKDVAPSGSTMPSASSSATATSIR